MCHKIQAVDLVVSTVIHSYGQWRPAIKSVLIGSVLLLIGACAVAPTRYLQSIAKEQGLPESVERSIRYDHRVYRNTERLPVDELNVYLEGDGLPWVFRYIVVSDPTPRVPMMLSMMTLDPSPSMYLGRPCYNGFADAPGCEPALWTSARYSPIVANSMVEVLRNEIAQRGVKTVNLFGHSGGGALAMLMAEQIPEVSMVVTLAGNLDIVGWTSLHGYSPLFTSLNPAQRPPLPAHITQVHLLGGRDGNIPPQLVSRWISSQQNSYGVVFKNYDHSCCWADTWKGLLRQIKSRSLPLQFSTKPFKRPARRWLLDAQRRLPNSAANLDG